MTHPRTLSQQLSSKKNLQQNTKKIKVCSTTVYTNLYSYQTNRTDFVHKCILQLLNYPKLMKYRVPRTGVYEDVVVFNFGVVCIASEKVLPRHLAAGKSTHARHVGLLLAGQYSLIVAHADMGIHKIS